MEHITTAHYDGEGVYAWDCWCGDADTNFHGLEIARDAGRQHELENEDLEETTV